EFGRERVHLLSQSSNDLNLTFVVDEAFAEDLMPTLHALLIASGAMPVDESLVFGPSWNQIESLNKVQPTAWWQTKRDVLIGKAVDNTPLYVYDLATVRAQAKALKGVAAIDRHFYAIKANSHPEILRTLYAEGFGLECVSQSELQHVLASVPNIKPDDILFTPSFAPRAEYAFAFDCGVNVTIDSIGCLQQWPDLFANKNIILRIDPGFGQGHHAKVRTGGKEAKFGLAVNDVPAFEAEVKKLNTRVVGLHSHIGSGIVDAQHWATVYAQLAAIADRLGTVSSIDVGGGIAVPYKNDDAEFDLQAYADVLAELKAAYPQYQCWVEPGRFMVAQAGVL
ncbi:MAG: bifunctional aspartate kinase/diaminopimelate decarboxylase, partial [Arenimonas sp.]